MIKFTVPGNPVAKGRPRFSNRGKFVTAYTPAKTKIAEKSISEYAIYHMGLAKPLSGPLSLQIDFYMPIPKSLSKVAQQRLNGSWHVSRPDADNLFKLASDALNGICYIDDSQIATTYTTKRYSDEPRTEIFIEQL